MPLPDTPAIATRPPVGKRDVLAVQVVGRGAPHDQRRAELARRRRGWGAPGARGPWRSPRRVRGRGDPGPVTRPPVAPAPGPISTRWSAARMTSASCSTTTTVLPRVAQLVERVDELRRVSGVQAERGLVEDVGDAGQAPAELRREPGASRLASGQAVAAAVERQVGEPDAVERREPPPDLPERLGAQRASARAPGRVVGRVRAEEGGGLGDGQGADLGDIATAVAHPERGRLQPAAAAVRAGHVLEQGADGFAAAVGVHPGVLLLDERGEAPPGSGEGVDALPSLATVVPRHLVGLGTRAPHGDLPRRLVELGPGPLEVDPVRPAGRPQGSRRTARPASP